MRCVKGRLSFLSVLSLLSWREGHQRTEVTGSEGRKFTLLSLNCHLMFMQSETVSESDRPVLHDAPTPRKEEFELIKPAALLI